MITVTIEGEKKQFPAGVSYESIAEAYQEKYDGLIGLVAVDGKIKELFKQLKNNLSVSKVPALAEQVIKYVTTDVPLADIIIYAKELIGVDCEFPHRFVADWMNWQNDYVNRVDLLSMTDGPVYEETARLSLVHIYKRKELLNKSASVRLYGDRICVDDRVFPFSDTSAVVVLGKNKLNLYSGNDVFQLKGSKRFNALKYVNFYHRYKNMTTGDHNGQFLGL